MNVRPELHKRVNTTETCSCGKDKIVHKQWCDSCWDLIPIKAGRVYKLKSDALARSIISCERILRELLRDRPQV